MSIILILLGLLLILLILRLFVHKEGFEDGNGNGDDSSGDDSSGDTGSDSGGLDPNTVQSYNQFMSFYTPFCTNWEKAIQSSVATTIPQQPLTDPKQTQAQQAPPITQSQMNNYISTLEQQLAQPLPRICVPLPGSIDSNSLSQVLPIVPSDPQPYMNALNWMNTQLEKSHSNLGSALQGGSTVEGFDECQDIARCIASDPDIARELQQQMAAQNAETQSQKEQDLMSLLNPFNNNQSLQQALSQNQQLVQKSQDIQNQAQSGQLASQVNTPDSNQQGPPQQFPPGSNNLANMKQNNPQQYQNAQQSSPQMFSLATLFQQINSTF